MLTTILAIITIITIGATILYNRILDQLTPNISLFINRKCFEEKSTELLEIGTKIKLNNLSSNPIATSMIIYSPNRYPNIYNFDEKSTILIYSLTSYFSNETVIRKSAELLLDFIKYNNIKNVIIVPQDIKKMNCEFKDYLSSQKLFEKMINCENKNNIKFDLFDEKKYLID